MDDLATRVDGGLGRLEGEYKHLATKQDVGELRGELRGMKAALWAIAALIGLMEVISRLGV